jgi:hypothetical protein
MRFQRLAIEHQREPSVVTRHDFREASPRLKHPSHWQRPAPCGAPCLAVLPAVLPSQRSLYVHAQPCRKRPDEWKRANLAKSGHRQHFDLSSDHRAAAAFGPHPTIGSAAKEGDHGNSA